MVGGSTSSSSRCCAFVDHSCNADGKPDKRHNTTTAPVVFFSWTSLCWPPDESCKQRQHGRGCCSVNLLVGLLRATNFGFLVSWLSYTQASGSAA
jgi:hypothetical protein